MKRLQNTRSWVWIAWISAALAGSGSAHAEAPLWSDAEDVPLPAGAQSVAPKNDDTPLFQRPGARDARRGTAVSASRLPIYSAFRGIGCSGRWLEVGPYAWVCSDQVEYSSDPSDASPVYPQPGVAGRPNDGLPYRYFFAGANGAYGYSSFLHAGDEAPESSLEKGWAVAIAEERTKGGETWGRTTRNQWINMAELGAARSFPFHGHTFKTGEKLATVPSKDSSFEGGIGWVVSERASTFASAKSNAKVTGFRVRFSEISLETRVIEGKAVFFKIFGEDAWVRAADLAVPTQAPRPKEAGDHERWIDVDLATQTLVAFEGDTPAFATLVSTGRGAQGTETATPKGVHRIWAKLFTTAMDNLEREDAAHYYSIDEVPWVQFFNKGVALHGAFWHRNFGHVQSHGCVNVAPIDAQMLFTWTTPNLPGGWTAALPAPVDRGTVVRVR